MITALALCTHLMAAKTVTNCKQVRAEAATFQISGHKGVLMHFASDEAYQTEVEAEDKDENKDLWTIASDDVSRTIVAMQSPGQDQWNFLRSWVSVTHDFCSERAQAIELEARIAHERANPGGVVNLGLLHELGRQLQEARELMTEINLQYKSVTNVSFNVEVCKCSI